MLPNDLSKLRVVDLKAELTQRSLPVKGKKDELIARLQQWINENKEQEDATANEQPQEVNGQQEEQAATEKEESQAAPPQQQDSMVSPPVNNVEPEPEPTSVPAPVVEQQQQQHQADAETQPATTADSTQPVEESKPKEATQSPKEGSKAVAVEEPMKEDKPVAAAAAAASVEEQESEKRPAPAEEESDIKGTKRKRLDTEAEKSTEKRSKASTDETTDMEAVQQQQQDTSVTSSAIYIKGFVRPLIIRHVQELINQYGTVKRFWMDAIKTHCYVIYETEKEAKDAFGGIDGIVFPRDTGRKVQVGGLTPEQAEALIGQEQTAASKGIKLDWEKAIAAVCRGESLEANRAPSDQVEPRRQRLSGIGQITRELQKAATASVLAPGSALPEERSIHFAQTDTSSKELERQLEASAPAAPTASLDELFRKTTALPALYYLPVAEQAAKQRLEKLDPSSAA
ncbi:hypothetical protein BDB00DRAFT_857547 [Zychaea mexicana]|uniref:uncharacterized protein n=1 Tax=Zychaea mexicana TaxID=64656 RepID=UPI0022FE85CA|nr:uncharacterized protein BDB00DRAFT_857547 [Zychaea mexicana]KAI9482537.1 hypothetical protein BDB00DRAFT_857547 [Zychaea mexicana]